MARCDVEDGRDDFQTQRVAANGMNKYLGQPTRGGFPPYKKILRHETFNRGVGVGRNLWSGTCYVPRLEYLFMECKM